MAVFDVFSKRKKRLEKAGQHDVYQYEILPPAFRVQVAQIWKTAIGPFGIDRLGISDEPPSNSFWRLIHETLCREKGLFFLGGQSANPWEQCLHYLLNADTDGALDIIELSFRVIDRAVRKLHPVQRDNSKITQDPDDAIEELNQRFQEHSIGYQYAGGVIIRLDSQFAHAEIVKPALSLLNQPGFDGPADEFISALDHYRHKRYKEAVADALKALESTLKAICIARKWPYAPNATAKPLMDVVFTKGLIPAELQSHFAGLRSAMESGLPTLSNRTSRHGQGPDPTSIPGHFAAYALHLAASNIVFLVEAHESTR